MNNSKEQFEAMIAAAENRERTGILERRRQRNEYYRDEILLDVGMRNNSDFNCALDGDCGWNQPVVLWNRRKITLPSDEAMECGDFYIQRLDLGVKASTPNGYALLLLRCIHSNPDKNTDVFIANGVIDSGYRGRICAVLYYKKNVTIIRPGDLMVYLLPVKLATSYVLNVVYDNSLDPVLAEHMCVGKEKIAMKLFNDVNNAIKTGEQCIKSHCNYTETHVPIRLIFSNTLFKSKRVEDAGYDVCAPFEITVPARTTIRVTVPFIQRLNVNNMDAYIFGRSSKNVIGVIVLPTVWIWGSLCEFYIFNATSSNVIVKPGEKIAQVVLLEHRNQSVHIHKDIINNFEPFPSIIFGNHTIEKLNSPDVYPKWHFTTMFNYIAPPSDRGNKGFGSTDVE
ncbi:dUTPase [Cercopithecine alphaherpesvirus 9]|uniref:dUTPase n=1 Tax=Cercopithecine herpesvirus 9 (strain DHV) TaxID=36348 RepID=Q9E208_CHV9D|nr:deoxyuridine triphosphatase [Cercopithecine alphaherpesvirus 9]AAG27245.1 dUTPase [Cercopithecine alphaherpesvirus 9]